MLKIKTKPSVPSVQLKRAKDAYLYSGITNDYVLFCTSKETAQEFRVVAFSKQGAEARTIVWGLPLQDCKKFIAEAELKYCPTCLNER